MDVRSIKNRLGKVNWTIVSVILALFFGLFTVYVYYAEHPNITFDIVNNANVLDVHKPLSELNIYFQGEDIQQSNLNLRIISVKIENTGNVNILQNFYDVNDIFGLRIDNGQIIESRLIYSNSEYLMSNLNLKTVNNTLELSKPIFEKNKYFIVDILILHDKNEEPTIVPLGKIAGIDRIELRKSYAEKQTFFDMVFSGSLSVHLIRLLIYLFICSVFLIFILLIASKIDTIRNNRRKHKRTLLVNKLDFFDGYLSSENKTIIKKILICIQQDEWRKIIDLLKIYGFKEDSLKPNLEDDLLAMYDAFRPYYYADFMEPIGPSSYRLMKTIGSYLYKHGLLEEILDQSNLEPNKKRKFKIKEQFFNDLESSISFLQNI